MKWSEAPGVLFVPRLGWMRPRLRLPSSSCKMPRVRKTWGWSYYCTSQLPSPPRLVFDTRESGAIRMFVHSGCLLVWRNGRGKHVVAARRNRTKRVLHAAAVHRWREACSAHANIHTHEGAMIWCGVLTKRASERASPAPPRPSSPADMDGEGSVPSKGRESGCSLVCRVHTMSTPSSRTFSPSPERALGEMQRRSIDAALLRQAAGSAHLSSAKERTRRDGAGS